MSAPATSRSESAWRGDAPVTLRRLWLGLVLAPSAWLAGELLGYYVTARSCDTKPGGVPLPGSSHPAMAVVAIEIAVAIVAAFGLFIAVQSWRKTRGDGDTAESAAFGRAHFMSFTGVIASSLFLLGIIWLGFPAIVVNACNQVR
jgi:uncharacterized protein YneF (UPF0154 family)